MMDKINCAIRACIRQCFGSNAILASVADFLDDLRQQPGWTEAEILVVETGVRRMLIGLVASEGSKAA